MRTEGGWLKDLKQLTQIAPEREARLPRWWNRIPFMKTQLQIGAGGFYDGARPSLQKGYLRWLITHPDQMTPWFYKGQEVSKSSFSLT